MPKVTRDIYWAKRPCAECVDAVIERVKAYQKHLNDSGRVVRMQRSWDAYYGPTTLEVTGEQGELLKLTPPIYPTLVRQVERLLTGQKPAYKTRATNSDSGAIVEAMLGDALLDHYDRESDLPLVENEAVRAGIILSSGCVVLGWDTTAGEVSAVDPTTGKEYRPGDIATRFVMPWDVAFDPRDRAEKDRQWVAFRYPAKRYDLVAQKPELEQELLRAGSDRGDDSNVIIDRSHSFEQETRDDEDNVWVWEVRHKRTAALPNGRLLRFVNRDCVLFDSAEVPTPEVQGVEGAEAGLGPCKACGAEGSLCADVQMSRRDVACCEACDHDETPAVEAVEYKPEGKEDAGYPYPELLVFEFTPEKKLGRSEGHTASFDLLSLVEAINLISTAGMTNINMGAITNWWVAADASPNVERLSTGANLVKGGTKPELIEGVQISEAMMGFLELIRGLAQEAAGLNDVVMGDTPKGMPAQLAALLEAKAIQYHQQGQAAYYRLVERVRTGVLRLLQRFASEPRVTELVGKANAWAQKEWSKQDLSRVTKVVVEPVNPMMKTFAGRMSVIEMLGPDTNKDAKMSLMLTGTMEPQLDGPKAHEGRLAREKEMLRQGIGMPPVDFDATDANGGAPVFIPAPGEFIRPLISDRHWIDIPEYLSVLESPEARANEKVVSAVLDLVTEKQRLWAQMSPDLIAVLGGMPAPSTMAIPPLAPEESAQLAEEGLPKIPPMPGAGPDDVPDETAVNLPKPPPNPLSGEQPDAPLA